MKLLTIAAFAGVYGVIVQASGTQGTTRRYDVRMAMVGYTGLAENPDCAAMVDTLGYDSLIGIVQGVEGLKDDDGEPLDVVYRGRLQRTTKMSYCLPLPNDRGWCVDTLTGSAQMNVELTVYGETGRGAWLKADSVPGGPVTELVRGDCGASDKDQIRAEYPGGSTAGSPDGQPIQEDESEHPDPAKLFALAGVRRLRPGFFPANEPETAWGLRVLRALP
jgi:hypothetical protein